MSLKPSRLGRSAWALAAIVAWAACAAACARPEPTAPGASPKAPPSRMVFILIDALRKDHLPFYGYDLPTAPFLSGLADRGVIFESLFSTSGWTAPATASIFTGLYPFQHGVTTGLHATRRVQAGGASLTINRIPDILETMPEAMKKAGYTTFGVAENPNIAEEMGFAAGFDRFKNIRLNDDARLIHEALLEWRADILAAPRSFVYLHFMDTHGPHQLRRPWFRRFLRDDRRIAAYDSCIGYVDSHLAQMAGEFGWDKDTLIVVTADHGEELGDHGAFGHGHTLFAEIMGVPLLIAFPGGAHGGRRVGARVSQIDLLPTLRQVAGLPPDPRPEGRSLLSLARGEGNALPARPLLAHLRRQALEAGQDKTLHAIIDGDWKLIERDPGGPLLFRLSDDPGERQDQAARRPEVARAMSRIYALFEKLAPRVDAATTAIKLDPEAQERLRALGYVR